MRPGHRRATAAKLRTLALAALLLDVVVPFLDEVPLAEAAQTGPVRLWVDPIVPTGLGDRVTGPATIHVETRGAAQVAVLLWPVDAPVGGRRVGAPRVLAASITPARIYAFPWAADEPEDYVELVAVVYPVELGAPPATSAPMTVILDWRRAQLGTGAIEGRLGYPSEGVPALLVCAMRLDLNAFRLDCIRTSTNQRQFRIAGLEPGVYAVVAYLADEASSFAGGYTEAVRCGLHARCTDHSLVAVSVRAGETVSDADVLDWYAPPGTFPPRPE